MIYQKTVTMGQVWHAAACEDKAVVHHFTASDPGLNYNVTPYISAVYSSFDCFRLMFTDGVLNIVLVETSCYCCFGRDKQVLLFW
jgi:hypothetical protein